MSSCSRPPSLVAVSLVLCLLFGLSSAGASPGAAPPSGNAERGRALLLQRHDTGCILCHVVPGLPQGGAFGPPLQASGSRLGAEALRERIADARRFNPQTIMPPYRSTEGLHSVAGAYAGRALLTEQALEDIVAYLLSSAALPAATDTAPSKESRAPH